MVIHSLKSIFSYVYILVLVCFGSVHITSALSVHTLSKMHEQERMQDAAPLMQLGNHVIAEFMGCSNLDAYEHLEEVLRAAALAAHATVINVMTYKFSPQGMTGLVLLSESHISIHTWPEFGYASIDIYTCGEHVDVHAAIESLESFFKPQAVREIVIDRGYDIPASFDTSV